MTHPSSPDRVSAERQPSAPYAAPRNNAAATPNTARSYTLRKLIELAYCFYRNSPNDKSPVRTHDEAVEAAREHLACGFLRSPPVIVETADFERALRGGRGEA